MWVAGNVAAMSLKTHITHTKTREPCPSNPDSNPDGSRQSARERRSSRAVASLGTLTYRVFIAAVILILGAVIVVPRTMGAKSLTVLSNSMAPAIRTGDMVVIRPATQSQIAVGDVVTFRPDVNEKLYVTHRVVEINDCDRYGAEFVTRGDANNINDEPFRPYQLHGRVAYAVPFVGLLAENPFAAAAVMLGIPYLFDALKGLVKAAERFCPTRSLGFGM